MKKIYLFAAFALLVSLAIFLSYSMPQKPQNLSAPQKKANWFLLHRKSNSEFLYHGIPGDKSQSTLLKKFTVKAGVPGEKPTPLPQLLGKEYWVITGKYDTSESTETAPYFLLLDIPYSEEYPFGPTPYLECGGQCDWQLPGGFGLHGTAGVPERLSPEDPGSSGCVRHQDEDITYLYNILDPEKEGIRYYVQDI